VTLPALMRPRPALAQIRVLEPMAAPPLRRTRIRLWLPLTPLFWILAPFAFLLAPLLLLAPPMWRTNPYVTVAAIGRVLTAMGGTLVDVDTPDARIRIKIL